MKLQARTKLLLSLCAFVSSQVPPSHSAAPISVNGAGKLPGTQLQLPVGFIRRLMSPPAEVYQHLSVNKNGQNQHSVVARGHSPRIPFAVVDATSKLGQSAQKLNPIHLSDPQASIGNGQGQSLQLPGPFEGGRSSQLQLSVNTGAQPLLSSQNYVGQMQVQQQQPQQSQQQPQESYVDQYEQKLVVPQSQQHVVSQSQQDQGYLYQQQQSPVPVNQVLYHQQHLLLPASQQLSQQKVHKRLQTQQQQQQLHFQQHPHQQQQFHNEQQSQQQQQFYNQQQPQQQQQQQFHNQQQPRQPQQVHNQQRPQQQQQFYNQQQQPQQQQQQQQFHNQQQSQQQQFHNHQQPQQQQQLFHKQQQPQKFHNQQQLQQQLQFDNQQQPRQQQQLHNQQRPQQQQQFYNQQQQPQQQQLQFDNQQQPGQQQQLHNQQRPQQQQQLFPKQQQQQQQQQYPVSYSQHLPTRNPSSFTHRNQGSLSMRQTLQRYPATALAVNSASPVIEQLPMVPKSDKIPHRQVNLVNAAVPPGVNLNRASIGSTVIKVKGKCGTAVEPGACCRYPKSCLEPSQIEDETGSCSYMGQNSLCCAPNSCR